MRGSPSTLRRLGLAAQTARADLHADAFAADVDDLLVQVGAERAVGARRLADPASRVLVTDVPSEGRAFAADSADRWHSNLAPMLDSGQRSLTDASNTGQTEAY